MSESLDGGEVEGAGRDGRGVRRVGRLERTGTLERGVVMIRARGGSDGVDGSGRVEGELGRNVCCSELGGWGYWGG